MTTSRWKTRNHPISPEMLARLHCFKTNTSNSKGSWKFSLATWWKFNLRAPLIYAPLYWSWEAEKKKEHTEREMQNFLCQLSGMKEMFMQNQLFWEPWKKGEDPHHTITAAPCTEHPGFSPSEIKSNLQPWDLPWHFISLSDHTILTWYKSTMKYWRA